MASVEKLGGSWVIVRGRDGEADDTASEAVREFWSGDNWVRQYGFAMQFWTPEEAHAYLGAHPDQLT